MTSIERTTEIIALETEAPAFLRIRRIPLFREVMVVLAILAIVWGQRQLADEGASIRGVLVYAIGAMIVAAVAWPVLPWVTQVAQARAVTEIAATFRHPVPIVALGVSVMGAGAAFWLNRDHPNHEPATGIAIAWGLGMIALLVVAFWGARPSFAIALGRGVRWEISAGIAVLIVAALARLLVLDRFTTIPDSDEGFFLLDARRAVNGEMNNPFVTGFFTLPELYKWTSGWVGKPFGDDIAAYRVFSAVLGVLSVFAIWRLATRLFGAWIGLASAAILSLMPLHLWASRNTLNNISDAFALAFAMWFIDRAIVGRHRRDAILSGIMLAIGLYGYWGARAFPIVIALIILVAVIMPETRLPWIEALRLGAWTVLGLFVTLAPLAGFYSTHRNFFLDRVTSVTAQGADSPTIADRIERAVRTLCYPFIDQVHGYLGGLSGGFYRFGPPFLGWILAPLVAIGVVTWIAWFFAGLVSRSGTTPRATAMLIAWVLIAGAVAQTESAASQRQLSMTFIWAAAGATGLVVALCALWRLMPILRRVLLPIGLAVLIAIGATNATTYFSEDEQVIAYGDNRSIAVYDIATRISWMEAYPTHITSLTAGVITYGGFATWQFLDPGMGELITDRGPIDANDPTVPVLGAGEWVLVTGEWANENRCMIQTRNPAAWIAEAHSREGVLLYTVFVAAGAPTIPTDPTVGESTLTPVTDLGCTTPVS